MKIEMSRQDLLELYQLTAMYARCYGLELGELIEGISEKYKKNTNGEDIRNSHNPRCAGRKKVYAENTDKTILELRNGGMTLRGIAGALQCSVTMLHRPCTGCLKTICRIMFRSMQRCMEINFHTPLKNSQNY